jgi:outer membrane receptor for Fe3+-dicitrate
VGTVEEVLQVTAESPVVDMSSTTAGGVLDTAQLQALPVGRKFTETLYMVPGVSDGSGVGAANPSISGSSGLNNNYIVDGVNITNTGYGGVGVYTFYFGSLGSGVTTDFIKETQVKSAGFEAEYGEANGGVVNVLTKSGSNVFHGSLFGYWRPAALESSWRSLETPNGTVNTTAYPSLDVGVSAGGPLVRDRLFVFGAFNPQYETRTLLAPDDVESFPLRALGETDRDRRTLSYAAKLTW